MERRNFIKTAGGAALLSRVLSVSPGIQEVSGPKKINAGSKKQTSLIRIQDDKMFIDTLTQTATITSGFLTSLKNKSSGEEFIQSFDQKNYSALQLVYPKAEIVDFNEKH